jgi:predicted DCC family thiol-disulfide oxidoreductase YuxK
MNENQYVNHPILIYDGSCGLCNRSVQYILKQDRRDLFRFASNASPAGKALLEKMGLSTEPPPESMVVILNNQYFMKSTAALKIADQLGGRHHLIRCGWFLPHSIRDGLYDVIARNRYRWFGKSETCLLPSMKDRQKFLDSTDA